VVISDKSVLLDFVSCGDRDSDADDLSEVVRTTRTVSPGFSFRFNASSGCVFAVRLQAWLLAQRYDLFSVLECTIEIDAGPTIVMEAFNPVVFV